jgi:hypothetical protein
LALQDYQTRPVRDEIVERAGAFEPKAPLGVTADIHNAIAWGAGMEVKSKASRDEMIKVITIESLSLRVFRGLY